MTIKIRAASEEDFDDIFRIFRQVVATGESYIYPEDTTREQAMRIWMHETDPYVVELDGNVIGTYVIRPNKIGRGGHVCNAGFMIDPQFQGRKIGRQMCEHALKEAKKLGYLAMQFNVVVSTNEKAVRLWKSMGFNIIGAIPHGFDHKHKGLVDIYIMHRFL